ncbi:unnamed protein product [Rhodiola kirilowii]
MVEGCFMKKKMLKIKSKHHGHGFKHHGGLVCGALAGHPGGIGGVDHIVVVLRGRHHHHRHVGPFHSGEDHGHYHGKHHHKGHGHGPIEAGLKHRGGRHHHHHHHHHRCRGSVGLIFQHHGGEGSGAGGEQQAIEAAPVTPTVPQTEAMMNNLTLEADNEANQP